MSNFDNILLALCKLNRQGKNGSFITCLHDEAKGYVFKTFQGEWKRVDFDFANSLAGLGKVNMSLL
jgi:hypothetical protein